MKISLKRLALTIACAFVITIVALGYHHPGTTDVDEYLFYSEYFIQDTDEDISLLYKIKIYRREYSWLKYQILNILNDTVTVCTLTKSNTCQDVTGRLIIPDSVNGLPVDDIDDFVFRDNQKITSVKLPSSLHWLGSSAFRRCTGLTSVTFPKTLEEVGSYSFEGCSNLTNVVFEVNEDTVVNLGYNVFDNCEKLESITLPAVFNYNSQVFRGCTNLKSITVYSPYAKYVSWNEKYEKLFEDVTYNTATLYVPFGTKAEYENRSPWKYFKNIVETDDLPLQTLPTGITNSQCAPIGSHRIYTLDGKELNAVPERKGIYIVNGRKVVR